MEPTMISGIGQVSLVVRDLGRAVAFYRDTLGIPLVFEVPNMAFFVCGGLRIMMTREEGGSPPANSVLYFSTDSIDELHARLLSQGVRSEREPHLIAKMPDHDLWMSFFRDSEDNLMALMEERRG
jgi:methylmalonyl-CoA/ethylmalonyl-CoA epimerase